MFFEKLFESKSGVIGTLGVCSACNYNSGMLSLTVEPNKTKESGYSSRYNSMRNLENQGKGCSS